MELKLVGNYIKKNNLCLTYINKKGNSHKSHNGKKEFKPKEIFVAYMSSCCHAKT